MYCGPSPDKYLKKHNPSAASNPFYSTRTSIFSLVTSRRSSSASVLSERRPSYQYEKRRCLDASILSDRSSGTDIKREVVFSPIYEHHEEVSVSQYEITSHLEKSTNELGPSKSIKAVVEQVTESCIKLKNLENMEVNIDQDSDNEENLWSAKGVVKCGVSIIEVTNTPNSQTNC